MFRCGHRVVKTCARPGQGQFRAEAFGLAQLGSLGVPVPEVLHADDDGLVLSFLGRGEVDDVGLAEAIATLHGSRAPSYGLDQPIWIATVELPGGQGDDWHEVFVEHRIRPLIHRTRARLGRARVEAIERSLSAPLPVEGPVWLHGDLWGGNVVHGTAGPALIDPSCWPGERGVDLAMMQLFGGFSPDFWAAYEALRPIPDPVKASLPRYQLYYLLVHVELFGAAYLGAIDRCL